MYGTGSAKACEVLEIFIKSLNFCCHIFHGVKPHYTAVGRDQKHPKPVSDNTRQVAKVAAKYCGLQFWTLRYIED